MTGCCAPNCHNHSGNGKVLFAVPRAKCAAQCAIVSDNGRSLLAPDKSEEAELSPSKLAIVIFGTSDRVLDLERRLDLEQKRRRKAEREGDRLRELLGRVFSSDQINVLEKGTMRGNSWSPASLQKVLHVKVACGSKGCEFVRENIAPLPATRALQKQIDHIKFKPGILHEVFAALKEKVATMAPEDRHACLLMDEVQILPGLDYDASTGNIIERIKKACKLDAKHQLKLLPHLKLRDLDPSNFEKMNVATAHALFHHATAAGLRYFVHKNHLPEEALTTAFFLEQVFRWFAIMPDATNHEDCSE
ncbi:hypothetical protein MRX96_024842 [Rhipicephalus microplus]